MGFLAWGQQNWFDLLQSIGIIGSLLLSCASFLLAVLAYRKDARARQFSNRIAITGNHRELSVLELTQPGLSRVRKQSVDLVRFPLTAEEANFLSLRILHLSACFHGFEHDELEKPDRLKRDVRVFLSRPLPQAAWERARPFQDGRFVEFVEECLAEK